MNENFPRSLVPRPLRTADAECSHKRHSSGVVREVVGYFELHAKNDRERFVWFGVDDLVEHCKRYKGEGYKKRAVEYALKFLRRKHFISRRVQRRRGGVLRNGVIVTPHDSLFKRTKTLCEFVGRLNAPGRWQRDPETRSWFWVPKGDL